MRAFESAVEDWRDVWLTNIYTRVLDLHHRRELHNGMEEMLRQQGHPDAGYFWEAFHAMYIESQVLAIRRQADDDARTLSLRRLLGQLEQHANRLSRSWYLSRRMEGFDRNDPNERDRYMAEFHFQQATSDYDRFTEGPAGTLSRRLIAADREALLAASDKVVRYANRFVAHAERPSDAPVDTSYGDLDNAIELLGSLLRKYYLLIDGSGLVSVTPVMQGDWRAPFRSALAEGF